MEQILNKWDILYYLLFLLIAYIDYKKQQVSIILTILSSIIAFNSTTIDLKIKVLYILVPSLVFSTINIIYYFLNHSLSEDAIGWGDVYFLPVISLYFLDKVIYVIGLAFIIASIILKIKKRKTKLTKYIPLIPYFFISSIIVHLIQIIVEV